MSTSGANTQIHAQVWNGVSWGAPTLMSTIAAVITTFRPFDLEYETSGDRAIIAYSANVNNQFSYQIWNGAAWSVAATQAIALNTAPPRWIVMAQNPLPASDEIALIGQSLSGTGAVHGVVWTGVAWSNMGAAATWDTTVSNGTSKKAVDVAYEQQSGRALFIWADNTTGQSQYRIWNGAALTGNTLLA